MRISAQQAQQPLTYCDRPKAVHRDGLVQDHLPHVRRIAWHVSSRMSSSIALEDLIQIGIVALIEAAGSFEDRGVAFAAYASIRMRGAMIDELRKVSRMSRAGMANRRKLSAVRATIEKEKCAKASDADMIEALGVDASAYFAMIESASASGLDSLDELYSDQDAAFADPSPTAHDLSELAEEKRALTRALSHLDEREALVLQLFFVEELNLQEIGETLGVGAARVCQIKKAALAKSRAMLETRTKGEGPLFQDNR